jgi:hypothetical protein
MMSVAFAQQCRLTLPASGTVVWRSGAGETLAAHLERYPEEQLLRVRKQGGGTLLLVALKARELALARISADGLRVVAVAKLQAAELQECGEDTLR